ncbi:putative 5' to 3' DNA helicase-like protein [Vibrio phage 424E50-1]|nr:putative 5' to 3' DNA helicase-like protein [Vibrio phage 424E50-1]
MTSKTPYEDITIICGKAKGGDECGRQWYEKHKHLGVKIEYFIPEWDNITKPDAVVKLNSFGKKYNAKAGMDRNHGMGDTATHLIAFHDLISKGTQDMITYMRFLKKPVKVFEY